MPLHWRAWQVITARHGCTCLKTAFTLWAAFPARHPEDAELEQASRSTCSRWRWKECEYLPLIAQVELINVVVGIAREHHGRIPLAVASGGTRAELSSRCWSIWRFAICLLRW